MGVEKLMAKNISVLNPFYMIFAYIIHLCYGQDVAVAT